MSFHKRRFVRFRNHCKARFHNKISCDLECEKTRGLRFLKKALKGNMQKYNHKIDVK